MPITIRDLQPSDSIDTLTALLHDAYRPLGEMGLNYTAVDQSTETTRRRIERGRCLVAVQDGRLMGTITWYAPGTQTHCAWYERLDVAVFGQLAVSPSQQRAGVGSMLIAEVERRAREEGAAELALDTAEPAHHLIDFYARRGYRRVDLAHWQGKTYRSVIMSRALR
ncbi:MAG TPA: GNAT family N-acetyltransferase [Candidatus Dormibacteraeota bacterium]|nr:GNAT family N-acetyltransferase [Candidatus Dormibacteraeota bacterium]